MKANRTPASVLSQLVLAPNRKIAGLMSGTSCDGLDIAICLIGGQGRCTSVEVLASGTMPYATDLRNTLLAMSSAHSMALSDFSYWHAKLADEHAHMLREFCAHVGMTVQELDLLGSHGHTLFHAPDRESTHPYPTTFQMGEGDRLSVQSGIPVVHDFRQKETAKGREGAPLAGYVDELLFGDPAKTQFFLNIGGISNVSVSPQGEISCVLSTDTGPGNTLLDDAVRCYFQDKKFDDEGKIAATGTVHTSYLQRLLSHSFFTESLPKSTGREVFNREFWKASLPEELRAEDIIATLTAFTIVANSNVIRSYLGQDSEVLVSGGGSRNKTIMEGLQRELPAARITPLLQNGITADNKEAVMMAVLANECIAGRGTIPSMGKISFPF